MLVMMSQRLRADAYESFKHGTRNLPLRYSAVVLYLWRPQYTPTGSAKPFPMLFTAMCDGNEYESLRTDYVDN